MADPPDTEQLLERAGQGDANACAELWQRYRAQLRRMIAIRLDSRLAARIDPSDVLQETLTVANRRLNEYLRDRPMPFYPWLRRLACDQMADLRRKHIRAAQRTVNREETPPLSNASVQELAERLLARSGMQ